VDGEEHRSRAPPPWRGRGGEGMAGWGVLASPLAGSGDCWVSWGCWVPGVLLLEPRASRCRLSGRVSAGADGSCLLIGPVARSCCGAGSSVGACPAPGGEW